jgi:hypothetical protein
MAQLNNQNELVFVDQPAPVDIVRHDVPKDTPDVPVQISNDCPDLLRQIAARETQITIPCDEPVDLMRHLLQLPKMYEDYQSRFADQWEKPSETFRVSTTPSRSSNLFRSTNNL